VLYCTKEKVEPLVTLSPSHNHLDYQLLKILLISVFRLVCRLVIDVDVRPLDIREALQLDLQRLGHVVGISQGRVRVHDDVDFGDQSRARVITSDGVDAQDFRGVGQADVRNQLLDLNRGRDAHEEEEFAERGVKPDGRDEDRDEDGAHGIDPPFQLRSAHGSQDTEAVDHQVISVILPEDIDLRVLILQSPAV